MSKYEQVTPAARAIIVFDETREPLVLTDPSDAAAWMEAIDVTDGVYGKVAWARDAEVLRIEVQKVHRADERVAFTPTGLYDLPGLRARLAQTRPELADADLAAIDAFVNAELAAQRARQESRWRSRISRWLHRRRPG